MIKLDKKYTLENNSVHGVELVFREERIKKTKEGKKEPYTFEDRWFYPDPKSALKRWIILTDNSVDLEGFIKHQEKISKELEKIYNLFVENKFKI